MLKTKITHVRLKLMVGYETPKMCFLSEIQKNMRTFEPKMVKLKVIIPTRQSYVCCCTTAKHFNLAQSQKCV